MPSDISQMIKARIDSIALRCGDGRIAFTGRSGGAPPEILATGHTRCPISLKEDNVREWLSPSYVSKPRLEEILSDHVEPYYEHRIAA